MSENSEHNYTQENTTSSQENYQEPFRDFLQIVGRLMEQKLNNVANSDCCENQNCDQSNININIHDSTNNNQVNSNQVNSNNNDNEQDSDSDEDEDSDNHEQDSDYDESSESDEEKHAYNTSDDEDYEHYDEDYIRRQRWQSFLQMVKTQQLLCENFTSLLKLEQQWEDYDE